MSMYLLVLLALIVGVPLVIWTLGLMVTSIAAAIDLLIGDDK
jgi:hypothetical protein